MRGIIFPFLLVVFSIFWNSCVNLLDTEQVNKNNPPNTTMANIPLENDTLYASITLLWDGEDNDGYVTAFQYRYTTYPLGFTSGDTIAHEWQETEESSLTIPFTSPDELNRQHFFVRAVDNSGNIDPTPATRVLYTTQTTPPSTEILTPIENQEFYATYEPTIWWPGVTLTITGEDRDGHIIEYGWSVDDSEWQWVKAKDSVVIIKPEDFAEPLDAEHTIKVISKDDTYLIDPVGDQVTIDLVVPTFEKDILILDDTREDVSLKNVDDGLVDEFYEDIFSQGNSYEIDSRNMLTRGFPSLNILGRYKLVIWHSDDSKTPFYITNSKAVSSIKSYLNVGGDLILSGVEILRPWYPQPDPIMGLPHPIPIKEKSFGHEYLHVWTSELSTIEGTFEGAAGIGEFSDVEIDPTKMNPEWPQLGKPHMIQLIVHRGGFTRAICTFVGPDPTMSGLPCAIRYYGDVFDLAFIGFPLWSLKLDDARIFANELLTNMGY